jgi:hypothetical protein
LRLINTGQENGRAGQSYPGQCISKFKPLENLVCIVSKTTLHLDIKRTGETEQKTDIGSKLTLARM